MPMAIIIPAAVTLFTCLDTEEKLKNDDFCSKMNLTMSIKNQCKCKMICINKHKNL